MESGVKKKILLVHNYYQIPGGEDTVVANEKRLLEEHGHKVVLYTRHNSELNEFSKMQKLLLPFSTIFNLRTYREVKELIEREQIEILHVHNTLNLVSPSVYYAGVRKRIPVIQTVHNFRLLCPGATFYREGKVCEDCVKKGMLCAVKHGCYRGSKTQTLACVLSTKIHRLLGIYGKINYICLTQFNKEKLLQLTQIKENQVFIKPNFSFTKEKNSDSERFQRQFVYVGRLEEIKGISILMEAWKKLGKEAPELILCGNGPLESWCRDYVEKNQMQNVHLMGFVPNKEVQDIIAKSTALILPTQVYEGFPMTIVEAYGKGTPVIASDLGNAGNLVIPGVTGKRFSYQSASALADAVRNFESFDSARIQQIYQEKYSAEKNYEELQKIYKHVSHKES